MGFRCPAQRPGAQSEPPWGQSLPRSFLQKLTHTTMERKIRRGSAIDVFIDYDGGRYRSSRQHPRGGPPSNVFVDYDGGHCRSSRQHPQGVRRRRLHRLRWWCYRSSCQHPQGASNRCVAKNLVPIASISAARHLPGDHNDQHYYGRQDKVSQENIP
jgi:hypothetical protein